MVSPNPWHIDKLFYYINLIEGHKMENGTS